MDTSKLKAKNIVFGAHVVILDVDSEEESTYQIVGVDEADVKKGKISIISPLARALIGKREGDAVELHNPKGTREYEIVEFCFK